VFVSCRGSGTIQVIEPDLATRAIDVGAEPRALALDEAGRRLYVGLVTERALAAIDTDTLRVVGRRALELEPRVAAMTPRGVAVLPGRGSEVVFVSADLAGEERVQLYAAGRTAWHGQALIPAGDDLIVVHAAIDTGLSAPVSTGGYGGGVREPIEHLVAIIRDGEPSIYGANDTWRRLFRASDVTGAVWKSGVLYFANRGEGTVETWTPKNPFGDDVAKGSGMSGLAVDGDRGLRAFAAFDRTLISIALDGTEAKMVSVGPGLLPAEVAQGRALFHLAGDRRISGSIAACASCHPDGREDGLVWRLRGSMRQTPMLAGRLENTGPFSWLGDTQTLEANIHQTIDRLGGHGIEGDEARALAAYLRSGLRAPVRPRPDDPLRVAAGKRIFEDPAVGCATCHDEARGYTDGFAYEVGTTGRDELAQMRVVEPGAQPDELDVPSLLYVGLSAPYFHDGSVKTLDALIAHNGDRMGKTSELSAEEQVALVAFLRSL
jgi:mono/diheme cytochrome c family protein